MKAAAIVNAHAEAGMARYRWPKAAAALARRLGAVEVRFTTRPGDATGLAQELACSGYDPVIAAGGDGTLNEVANGLLAAGCDVRLGILPIASGGDFARMLGLSNVGTAIETLAAGHWRRIDAVRTQFHGPDGATVRHFVNIASVGLGGLVTQTVQHGWPFVPGSLRYLGACLPPLAAGRSFKIRMCLDGGDGAVESAVTIVSLANGRYQGGGILIAPEAAIDDGLMDVTLVETVGLGEVLRHLRILYSGDIYSHPKVHHWRARRVLVTAENTVPLELDGEPLGHLPLEAEALPQALRLLSP